MMEDLPQEMFGIPDDVQLKAIHVPVGHEEIVLGEVLGVTLHYTTDADGILQADGSTALIRRPDGNLIVHRHPHTDS